MAAFGSTELLSELPLASPKRHRGDHPSFARRQSPRRSPRVPPAVGTAALEEGLDALEPLPAATMAPVQLMAPPQRRTSQARASRINVREQRKQSVEDAAAITEEGTYLSLSQVEAGDLVVATRKRAMPEAPDDEADHLPSPARTATVRRSCSLLALPSLTPTHRHIDAAFHTHTPTHNPHEPAHHHHNHPATTRRRATAATAAASTLTRKPLATLPPTRAAETATAAWRSLEASPARRTSEAAAWRWAWRARRQAAAASGRAAAAASWVAAAVSEVGRAWGAG